MNILNLLGRVKYMRELTDLEKKICEKQIKRIEESISHLEWLIKYNDLMLNEGLYRNYVEKVKEFKAQKQQLITDITNETEKIRILKDQINKGVDESDMIEVKGGSMIG
jgi:mevalonate kinase